MRWNILSEGDLRWYGQNRWSAGVNPQPPQIYNQSESNEAAAYGLPVLLHVAHIAIQHPPHALTSDISAMRRCGNQACWPLVLVSVPDAGQCRLHGRLILPPRSVAGQRQSLSSFLYLLARSTVRPACDDAFQAFSSCARGLPITVWNFNYVLLAQPKEAGSLQNR